ncbi:MAG: hypothetical protein RMX68_005790 [Aulosira sp. ZfuVER01]|nr:hypothetical protein [Aulosira sp. ZfuVER01]MDZ8000486.1 hypothetical protein [Aulosira sp. DedVER01a]MDZ8052958.1 hypothetical protein [Aulosira sp. ZfuCHP01]
MDSDVAQRIQALERTVDILTYHLTSTCLNLQELIDRLPDGELSPVRFGIEKNIELLQQVRKLSKQ